MPEMPSMIEPQLVRIPSGSFRMGSQEGAQNERPVHQVRVDEFAIAVHPVTNREYSRFLKATGHPPPAHWSDPGFDHPDQPVVSVNWFDAEAYCSWLKRESGKPYRLPSEAEREKAARGGVEGKSYPWGDELPDWMNPQGRGRDHERPDRAAQDPPNGFGLHNMGDLVHEWCSDWYDAGYYQASPSRNPKGPSSGVRRASRGGSWRHHVKVSRCAARSSIPPDRTFSDYGFRVAMTGFAQSRQDAKKNAM
ncbi:MAG: formylglycine-generating enzyme family protein [Acidobacteriota bacterium]